MAYHLQTDRQIKHMNRDLQRYISNFLLLNVSMSG